MLDNAIAGRALIVVAVLLAIPAVNSGFSSDDDILLTALAGNHADARPWYDLYYFAGHALTDTVREGLLPWWSAPHLRLHLVRPLPSAFLALDRAIFGGVAVGYHLHSILWLAALLALARALFVRLLSRKVATLAVLVFALSPNFTLAARLIAARHILIAGVAVAGGLLLLLESEALPKRRWLAALVFVLGLAAGEGGLAGLAFWTAYEAFAPAGRSRRARTTRALLPVGLGAVYLVVYALASGGAREMEPYVDPIHDPLGFVRAVALRMPLLLGNVVWGMDAGLGLFWPRAMIAAGILGTALIVWMFTTTQRGESRENGALQWLVPGALLSTVGVCGGMPGGRELVIPCLGFAPLVATVILRGSDAATTDGRRTWWPHRAAAALLLFVHGALAPLATLGTWEIVRRSAVATTDVARQMKAAARGAERVIVLTGSDPAVWIYALRLARTANDAHSEDGGSACWWLASAAKADHRVMRIDERALTLETIGTTFLSSDAERMYRAEGVPMDLGDEVVQCGARIAVTALRDGRPTKTAIRLDRAIDDPSLAVLAWQNGRVERVTTGETGSEMLIRWTAGPLGM
jgi:hypothetical protein